MLDTADVASQRRILVIDDNPAIHQDFKKIFGSRLKGADALSELEANLFGAAPAAGAREVFQVDSALQGQEGVALLRQAQEQNKPFSMAFVDVRMPPGWDGVQTTARIWEQDPDVQIVICTAYSDYSWEEILKKLGRSDRLVILKKPFDNIEVLQLADTLTEKWRLARLVRRRLEDLEQRVNERTHDLRAINTRLDVANRRLIAATERAREMADAALSASQAKSEFLANMSHEIRTPMNGVIGMAELLLGETLPPLQRDYVETIRDSARALLAIINDILDFSKIEAGKFELERTAFDLRGALNDVVRLIAGAAHAKNLKVSLFVDPAVPAVVEGDAGRLRQILINLCGNAVKFTSQGEVGIEVTMLENDSQGAMLRFVVRDTGIGIPGERLGALFKPFSQVDASTTRRFGGTGLGLSIVDRLVTMMGGVTAVESWEGLGSTFSFTARFGIATSAASPIQPPTLTAEQNRRASAGQERRRILLADDNAVNQKVARRTLEKLGYWVDVVGNGVEAVEAWQMEHYDLILMDCQMPQLDGYEATRKIRGLERGERHIPIVALTAHAIQGAETECTAAGMDAYISKPFEPDSLRALLERFLRDQ